MLPRFNRTIVARCDLGLLGFVDPQGKMTPSALPRGVIFPLMCTKRHGPVTACNSVQQLDTGRLFNIWYVSLQNSLL